MPKSKKKNIKNVISKTKKGGSGFWSSKREWKLSENRELILKDSKQKTYQKIKLSDDIYNSLVELSSFKFNNSLNLNKLVSTNRLADKVKFPNESTVLPNNLGLHLVLDFDCTLSANHLWKTTHNHSSCSNDWLNFKNFKVKSNQDGSWITQKSEIPKRTTVWEDEFPFEDIFSDVKDTSPNRNTTLDQKARDKCNERERLINNEKFCKWIMGGQYRINMLIETFDILESKGIYISISTLSEKSRVKDVLEKCFCTDEKSKCYNRSLLSFFKYIHDRDSKVYTKDDNFQNIDQQFTDKGSDGKIKFLEWLLYIENNFLLFIDDSGSDSLYSQLDNPKHIKIITGDKFFDADKQLIKDQQGLEDHHLEKIKNFI